MMVRPAARTDLGPPDPSWQVVLGRAAMAGLGGGAALGGVVGLLMGSLHIMIFFIAATVGLVSAIPVVLASTAVWLLARRLGAGPVVRKGAACAVSAIVTYAAFAIGQDRTLAIGLHAWLIVAAAVLIVAVVESWIAGPEV